MQTEDHYLLGYFLLEHHQARLRPICQKLFLLGCIEPDWNLITYARGSLRYRFLHGHNAENVRKHLKYLTEKLCKTGVQTPLQWFRFGAALHYLADSFTFAHNDIFAGSLKEHRLYEKLLHAVFIEYLQARHMECFSADEICHARYLTQQPSYQTDCRYILGTAFDLSDRLNVLWNTDEAAIQHAAPGIYG